jgi:hypothetical protein
MVSSSLLHCSKIIYIHFVASRLDCSHSNMTSSLHRLWLDLQIDETKNQTIVDTYKQMTDSISQICYLNKSLLEHAFPSLKAGLNSFMKRELGKLTEVKSHFDSLSGSLTEALSKKAAINKNKVQVFEQLFDCIYYLFSGVT